MDGKAAHGVTPYAKRAKGQDQARPGLLDYQTPKKPQTSGLSRAFLTYSAKRQRLITPYSARTKRDYSEFSGATLSPLPDDITTPHMRRDESTAEGLREKLSELRQRTGKELQEAKMQNLELEKLLTKSNIEHERAKGDDIKVITLLRSQIKKDQMKINELVRVNKIMDVKFGELKKNNESQKKRFEENENQISRLKLEKEEKCSELQEEVRSLQAISDKHSHELSMMNAECMIVNSENENLKARLNKLRQEHQNMLNERNVNQLKPETEASQSNITKMKNLEKYNAYLKQKVEEYKKNEREEEFIALKARKIEAIKTQNERLREENGEMRKRLMKSKELSLKHAELASSNEILRTEVSEWKEICKGLRCETEPTALVGFITALQIENQNLVSRSVESRSRDSDMKESKSNHKKESAQLDVHRSKIQDLSSQIAFLTGQTNSMKTFARQLQELLTGGREVEDVRGELSSINNAIDEITSKRISDLIEINNTLRGKLGESLNANSIHESGSIPEVKILHMKLNPDSVLRGEKSANNLESESISLENTLMKERIVKLEHQCNRLKEFFSQMTKDFRAACLEIFGFDITMSEEESGSYQTFTLKSIYSDSKDDTLVFRYNDRGVEMLATRFSKSLDEDIVEVLDKFKSLPAFISNLTLVLFGRQTQFI